MWIQRKSLKFFEEKQIPLAHESQLEATQKIQEIMKDSLSITMSWLMAAMRKYKERILNSKKIILNMD